MYHQKPARYPLKCTGYFFYGGSFFGGTSYRNIEAGHFSTGARVWFLMSKNDPGYLLTCKIMTPGIISTQKNYLGYFFYAGSFFFITPDSSWQVLKNHLVRYRYDVKMHKHENHMCDLSIIYLSIKLAYYKYLIKLLSPHHAICRQCSALCL